MTNGCPSAIWPSISLISDIPRAADATPSVEHGELAEGREDQQGRVEDKVQEPGREDNGNPEAHDEVRPPKVARRPILPTKAEIEEHYPLHLNFRSWCRHRVAGKSRLAQHVVQPSDRERWGVTVHMDYAFMTAAEAEEEMQPTLDIFDDNKD